MTTEKQVSINTTSSSSVRKLAQDLLDAIKASVESKDVAFTSANVRMSDGMIDVRATGTMEGTTNRFMYRDFWNF